MVGENGTVGIPALHLVKVEQETENVFVTILAQNTVVKFALLMVLQILKPNSATQIDVLVRLSVMIYCKYKLLKSIIILSDSILV